MSAAALRTRAAAALLAALAAALLLSATLAGPARAADQRIVALTPFTANTLMALGVEPIAIGALPSGETKISKRLKGVKRLMLNHSTGGPNLEELALLNPSLVLSAPIWNKSAGGMKDLGIRVVMSDPQRVDDIARQTEFIGQVIGKRKEAERYAAQQRRHIKVAKSRARRHPRVLLVLGVGRRTLAFLPSTWGGDLITAAGGRLVTAGMSGSGGYVPISAETILQKNPDVIIAVPHGNPQDIGKVVSFLKSNPAWKGTKAQRNGRIYVSTDNSLLQAWETAATSIADVQTKYLKNR